MLAGFARRFRSLSLPRAGYGAGLTSLLLLAGAGSVHDATALGETRTLSFHHTHSDEDLTVTFKRNGRYDDESLSKLNHFLRDWRSQDQTKMDPHLFDILWEVTRDVDATQPIQIISAYRAPATNAMLRRRSSGVARHSQHMLGHAMDFFVPGVPLEKIRFAGLRLQRGGVGFYPTSGSPFVHLDTGSIRHWPRMTRDQLARVFPDGRTVHLPTDGRPLAGYQLALADIQKRGDGGDVSSPGKPSLLASLFKGRSAEDDEEGAAPFAERATPAGLISSLRSAVAKSTDPKLADAQTAEAKSSDPVPMPRAKPATAATFQLASADEQATPAAKRKTATSEPKLQTPADIINARGFWDDMPLTPKQASPAQIAALGARQALAAADPQSTASVSATFQAMAYAPEPAQPAVDRAPVVTASAPIPRGIRPASVARNPMAVTTITTVVAKGKPSVVATSTRLAAAGSRDSDVWMRAMILAPSASTSMHSTVMGDADLTVMSSYFVKPQTAVAMNFSDDPQPGLFCDTFTGSAVTTLSTTPFAVRTAALR
ncbi:MAG: DUF882 domain-containing protein [Rhodopseudomonas sp.]|uniref:DUF882 domain-containing protein n=1 Tax=Rhodopseudomonas sp. TaxID=1078 RepID=UPI0017D0A22F|nr:DUF882 domain-containing protein [Rhodopseudomonas sp.]NVN88073.1 DUF882 domain-containing protein [Rhodopseudomonas sp.]